MKVKELLTVMFNGQCVALIRNGLKSSILFFGTVSDMPDEFKNFIFPLLKEAKSIWI